jgi:hypothetical protein
METTTHRGFTSCVLGLSDPRRRQSSDGRRPEAGIGWLSAGLDEAETSVVGGQPEHRSNPTCLRSPSTCHRSTPTCLRRAKTCHRSIPACLRRAKTCHRSIPACLRWAKTCLRSIPACLRSILAGIEIDRPAGSSKKPPAASLDRSCRSRKRHVFSDYSPIYSEKTSASAKPTKATARGRCSCLGAQAVDGRRSPASVKRWSEYGRKRSSARHQSPAAADRWPAAEQRLPAAADRCPAAERRLPAAADRCPATGRRLPAAADRWPAAGRRSPAARSRWSAAATRSSAARNRWSDAGSRRTAAGGQWGSAASRSPAAGDR